MGQDDTMTAEDTTLTESEAQSNADQWCCMDRVLSLQDDSRMERPLVQSIIEDAGHICLFLP